MNRWMMAAATMMAATTALHVFGGGPEIHVPIQASELAPYLRAISAVLWHAVTVILLVFTGVLMFLSRNDNAPLALTLVATQVGFSGLFIHYGLSQLGNVSQMPQWIIFLSISAVMLVGLRRPVSPVLRA